MTEDSSTDAFSPLIKWMLESHEHYLAEQELQSIITAIQSDPKTNEFLGPPTFDEVRDVLDDDTIVVVNSAEQCDAFIIDNKSTQIRVLKLPMLRWDDIEAWVARSKAARPLIDLSMLSWLWTALVHPVLEYLGFKGLVTDLRLPRIIWIATGPLCHLPIHAAGVYDGSSSTAMDYIISSYTSSLKALVASKKSRRANLGGEAKALLVSMDQTPNLRPLPFAKDEVQTLSNLCSSMFASTSRDELMYLPKSRAAPSFTLPATVYLTRFNQMTADWSCTTHL
jgi:hypothetical protein